MDLVGPVGLIDTHDAQVDQQASQGGRVQHVGVEQDPHA